MTQRLTVVRWDNDTIYGRLTGDADEQEVAVPLTDADERDWRYLLPLLERGSRLNVVNGLLILEPDHLVDISAIAACFESYAESPVVQLLNRIRPVQTGESIVLGTLASQLLDEEVHAAAGKLQGESCGQGTEPLYSESARTFFRQNAITLLTAELSPNFHEQGRTQQQNIRRAVQEVLPAKSPQFDAREVLLEPSFFSEPLGLQGRMDFLQADGRVLIEQKSGKGAFPEPDPDTPVPQLIHYIQLLLYMTLLRWGQKTGTDRTDLRAFLLYSKYFNALQQATFSEALLHRAIKVRNRLVVAERSYAHGGMSVLATLTPEAVNERGQEGKLWLQYVRPHLEELLSPMQSASPLERAYCLRFLTFLSVEHLRCKVGTGAPDNAGFAGKWRQTLDEKQEAGDICAGLRLITPAAGDEGKVDCVELENEGQETDDSTFTITNFRRGDIVILYPYEAGSEPDACRTMVFRGTIARMETGRVTVALRAAQTDARVFLRSAAQPWAVEHDFMESSFAPLYRGMYAFLSAPRERRDLILLQRQPRVDERLRLRLDHGAFNELALRVRQARDLFMIIGPPGTGKTSFGLMTTLLEELAWEGTSVLLLSYTVRAVDEICSKLTEAGIDFLRVGSRLSCAQEYCSQLLEEQVQKCQTLAQLRQLLMEARVVVGTTSALSARSALLELRTFSLAIVDEASQILEPYLMSLLAAQKDGRPAIRKFVMIGDHKQLPAVVQQTAQESRVEEPALREIGLTDCRLSLFERLLKRYARDPRVTYQLTRQGRMHPAVASFPNEAFYGGALREVPLPHQSTGSSPIGWPRLQFIDVPAATAQEGDAPLGGKVNRQEAAVIAQCVCDLRRRLGDHFTADSIGVIVPYRHQIAAVRAAIVAACGSDSDAAQAITIDTVERYQGSQRDTIIYGFTVSHPIQLDFLTELCFEEDGHIIDRKLNVAMTRAREHLILVGNAALLRLNPLYAHLLQFLGTQKAHPVVNNG